MTRYALLVEAVKERALERPRHDAPVHPAGSGAAAPVHRLSSAGLDAPATAVSAWLRARDAPGIRVLMAMDPGSSAAVALLGCLYAGAVAVPVPAPSGSRTDAERTAARTAARTAEGAGGFPRTGDPGLAVDGGLRMTGRLRDTLRVGRAHPVPQDVERELLCHGRPLGSAPGLPDGPGTGRLVVVQDVRAAGGARTPPPLPAARIRAGVAEEFTTGALPLVRPGTVRGVGALKVRRSPLRERCLRGELLTFHADFPPGLAEPARGGAA
ncbi:hypothetical protein HUT19_26180 [Streptomyces sp. NA02950]|uniref:hypothetical protein n=1 Tax=Streptomyces sp. NA02950 TaxID=2742137 RepID=UPI001590D435|nr:hypothetical protein [Streptomyces sp. NA02950]QKV94807.1 hypothetical protein HUT19_26180 [Streptomyces sp. NA02950]